jgi:hypothetical protein
MKDVEQAFWCVASLPGYFPCQTWNIQTMQGVMTACMIMHNLIVEEERDDILHD